MQSRWKVEPWPCWSYVRMWVFTLCVHVRGIPYLLDQTPLLISHCSQTVATPHISRTCTITFIICEQFILCTACKHVILRGVTNPKIQERSMGKAWSSKKVVRRAYKQGRDDVQFKVNMQRPIHLFFTKVLHPKWKENGDLIAGGQITEISLSCHKEVIKPTHYVQILWKPGNRESELGAQIQLLTAIA